MIEISGYVSADLSSSAARWARHVRTLGVRALWLQAREHGVLCESVRHQPDFSSIFGEGSPRQETSVRRLNYIRLLEAKFA